MKNLKKILCAVFCLALALCLFGGCTNGKTSSSSVPVSSASVSSDPVSAEEGPYKIGLIQYTENPSLDTIREAFMSRLEEYGYDESKVTVDYQNAEGDAAKIDTICRKFVSDKVDMIAAIATPAAQAAVSAAEGTDIKVLFAAVNDPATDLGIKNDKNPEGNVTGTSDRIPVTSIIDLALKADPQLETFGMLYTSSESNSANAAGEAREYCESKGITVIDGSISNTSELQQAAADLCGKADAVFTAADNTIASSVTVVANAAREAKIPWYVGTDSMVQDGALAAIGVDYTELGYQNADMAVELMEGRAVSEVPVYYFETYSTYINQDTLDTVGVTFPEDVLSTANIFTDIGNAENTVSAG